MPKYREKGEPRKGFKSSAGRAFYGVHIAFSNSDSDKELLDGIVDRLSTERRLSQFVKTILNAVNDYEKSQRIQLSTDTLIMLASSAFYNLRPVPVIGHEHTSYVPDRMEEGLIIMTADSQVLDIASIAENYKSSMSSMSLQDDSDLWDDD